MSPEHTFQSLSAPSRQALMSRVDEVMAVEFKLSSGARQSFWEAVSVGAARTKAC